MNTPKDYNLSPEYQKSCFFIEDLLDDFENVCLEVGE